MSKLSIIILLVALTGPLACRAQHSGQDSLRGSITPGRAWWNVLKYDITVEPDFDSRTIAGKNIISFEAVAEGRVMQIDLQQPMELLAATYRSRPLPFKRNGNVFYVELPATMPRAQKDSLILEFSGRPREAKNPPWDGGWIWTRDSLGNPWMSVACQLLGASVWYPCKDHQSDEPDSATLRIIVPDSLTGIGNGRLIAKTPYGSVVKQKKKPAVAAGKTMYSWSVVNPINNYNIIPYIGKYVNWTGSFSGEKGELDLGYWVLSENEEKARAQFREVPAMLKCFEHWFGPYPFYEDGYKIVESPHLGMEHQSAIAYGNKFANGYLGRDLSGTGWGDKWDFIIIHESGHEWFGNNITTKDVADMWVHEGFTNYSETLFTECGFGKEAGSEYCRGLRKSIQNDVPVIGPYNVNKEGSGDMYFKGGNLIHTIRQIIDDDEKFRSILRGLNAHFYHQTVTSAQVEQYIIEKSGKDLAKVFDQYLRAVNIPVLEYQVRDGKIRYRWADCVEGFNMPLKLIQPGRWLQPGAVWQEMDAGDGAFKPDPNFYVITKKL